MPLCSSKLPQNHLENCPYWILKNAPQNSKNILNYDFINTGGHRFMNLFHKILLFLANASPRFYFGTLFSNLDFLNLIAWSICGLTLAFSKIFLQRSLQIWSNEKIINFHPVKSSSWFPLFSSFFKEVFKSKSQRGWQYQRCACTK